MSTARLIYWIFMVAAYALLATSLLMVEYRRQLGAAALGASVVGFIANRWYWRKRRAARVIPTEPAQPES